MLQHYVNRMELFQNLKEVYGFGDHDIVDIAMHVEAEHYLALTRDGQVYCWGTCNEIKSADSEKE